MSKSRGQVLRVAAVFHVLFSVDPEREVNEEDADIIGKDAITASINFVNTASQHALYIAGKGNLEEEIVHVTNKGKCYVDNREYSTDGAKFLKGIRDQRI